VLVLSGCLTLRDLSLSGQISGDVGAPAFIGTYGLAIGKIACAAIIVWRGFPQLRLFAYKLVLTYLVLELIGMLSVQELISAASVVLTMVVWALAFWWDRDRIRRQASEWPT